jgi:hypothetical protein
MILEKWKIDDLQLLNVVMRVCCKTKGSIMKKRIYELARAASLRGARVVFLSTRESFFPWHCHISAVGFDGLFDSLSAVFCRKFQAKESIIKINSYYG